MIRKGTINDFLELELLCAEFWKSSPVDVPYKEGSALFYLQLALDCELLFVAEKDGLLVGIIAACITPLMGNNDYNLAAELVWYVDPKHRTGRTGMMLKNVMEIAAKEKGCHFMSMMYMKSSMPETIKSIYEKSDYQPAEQTYLRVL